MSRSLRTSSDLLITEMREFAGFTAREQRFIKIGLEIAADSKQHEGLLLKWSRDLPESRALLCRQQIYADIKTIKELVPVGFNAGCIKSLMGPLVDFSNHDLIQGYIISFSAYRFLYERIFGVDIRPWLPGAFCAAAAMPNIAPENRRMLLQSISEAAATAPGWSSQKTVFFPEWIDKAG